MLCVPTEELTCELFIIELLPQPVIDTKVSYLCRGRRDATEDGGEASPWPPSLEEGDLERRGHDA